MKDVLKLALRDLENAEIATNSTYESTMLIRETLAQPDYRAVKTYHEGKPVYVSQPVQEPDELTIAYMSGIYDGKKKRPWVGLTEAEIDYWLGCNTSKGAVARAIEKALKEKNI